MEDCSSKYFQSPLIHNKCSRACNSIPVINTEM
uniref:Uncharacterized protein n=1 Tax=Arundo donax TaxID=35708 RepID=A0A0A9AGI6_ARUDO